VLSYALRESDHSDGKLLLYATVVAVTAVAGVTATHTEQASRGARPSSDNTGAWASVRD
jgi:hypothetical protein